MTTLADLQARCPAGVTVRTDKHGNIKYFVRIMRAKKRVTLGTFIDLAAAKNAIIDYDLRNPTTQEVSNEKIAAAVNQALHIDIPDHIRKELETYAPHELLVENKLAMMIDDVLTLIPPVYIEAFVNESCGLGCIASQHVNLQSAAAAESTTDSPQTSDADDWENMYNTEEQEESRKDSEVAARLFSQDAQSVQHINAEDDEDDYQEPDWIDDL